MFFKRRAPTTSVSEGTHTEEFVTEISTVKDRKAGGIAPAALSRSNLFYDRNWAFISPEIQALLRTKVIFAAGVGLASTILTAACRTGFTQLIVADGDAVDVSNLNRQAYSYAHVGANKAVATAEILRSIQPEVNVEVLPRFLDEDSYQEPLQRADIVISSVDFDNPLLFTLNDQAQALGKPVVVPINLGWGGALLVFTATSISLEEFLGGRPEPKQVGARLISRIFERSPLGLPPYLAPVLAQFVNQTGEWRDPQLGAAAFLTAAMTVRAAVALAAGEPVRQVPEVLHCDLRQMMDPGILPEPGL